MGREMWLQSRVNPNPHCFKAITPNFLLCSPEDLRNKNVNYTHCNQKLMENGVFLWKIHATKKFVEISCEIFLII
jgi:hypothetical protein